MLHDPEPAFPEGHLLNKFRLKKRLGFGGMGEVWLAQDTLLRRDVALKVILPRYTNDAEIRSRFLDEAAAAAQVEHERIVRILEVGQHERNLFIAMELLKGRDLQTHLQNEPIPPLSFTLKLIVQVLQGLSAAHTHENRLIHRDIKPQNVWIEASDDPSKVRVKILDFGIAKGLDPDRRMKTQTGAVIGTLPYMSYEQLRGRTVDARSDLHSVGVMLYQMLTGRLPFESQSIFDMEEELRNVVPPSPNSMNGKIPIALSDFTLKLIAYDPNARPSSAAEAIATLNEIVKKPKPVTESKVVPEAAEAAAPIPAMPLPREVSFEDEPRPDPRTSPPRPVLPSPRDSRSRHDTSEFANVPEAEETTLPTAERSILKWVWGGVFLAVVLMVGWLTLFRGGSEPGRDKELVQKKEEAKQPKSEPKRELDKKDDEPKQMVKNDPKVPVKVVPKKPDSLDCTGEKGADTATVKRVQKAWADYLGVEVNTSVDLGGGVMMEFVLIPPGTFWRGATDNDPKASHDEKPLKKITISEPFFVAKYEVTRGQFARFVAAENYQTEAEQTDGGWGYDDSAKAFTGRDKKRTWKETGWNADDSHPVVNVSWNDAQKFNSWVQEKLSAKLSKGFEKVRLPREAEWEYVAHAGTKEIYLNGDDPKLLAKIGNVAYAKARGQLPDSTWTINPKDTYRFTAPVGKFDANAFGLHDMTGNVWEWCEDWYDADYYKNQTVVDPNGPDTGIGRVLRGGSFNDVLVNCRVACRYRDVPSYRYFNYGFRVVCVR